MIQALVQMVETAPTKQMETLHAIVRADGLGILARVSRNLPRYTKKFAVLIG